MGAKRSWEALPAWLECLALGLGCAGIGDGVCRRLVASQGGGTATLVSLQAVTAGNKMLQACLKVISSQSWKSMKKQRAWLVIRSGY